MYNPKSIKDNVLLVFKGAAMGAADIVPGVSGGTVAFITGIYDLFIESLKRISPALLLRLRREGFKNTWEYINGTFLLVLFTGIIISIKTGAAIVGALLDTYPLLVWGFFTGLILASVVVLCRQEKLLAINTLLPLLLGVVFVVGLAIVGLPAVPINAFTFFIGGFIAITAMILPGISGSFILLLVGLYPEVLNAINEMNMLLLTAFLAGCVSGLMVFSRFLSWLLESYRRPTVAVLVGFLCGSMYVTWPWKIPLKIMTKESGETKVLMYDNVMPYSYEALTQIAPDTLLTIAACMAGFVLVLGCEKLAKLM